MAMRLLPLNVGELCAHALELERACEHRFDDYAARMVEIGERPLAMAFDRMARTLRRETATLAAASGDRKPAELSPWEYAWRMTYMPEAADGNARPPATAREALQCALQARRRAMIFYEDVADNAADEEVRAYAAEMVAAKKAQQLRLERLLAREILSGGSPRPLEQAIRHQVLRPH